MLLAKLTDEHLDNADVADAFIHLCQPIFCEMTATLGSFAPQIFHEFQQYPLPNDAQNPCGAWSACAVNNTRNRLAETNVHRDVKESPYCCSCVFACGDYIGGDIVLYELRCKIESPGDVPLFPDSLIHHNNEKAEGSRKSTLAFNMND